MEEKGHISLNLLHDLALLYLALAHGADEHLDPAETRAISVALRQWRPDKDPALIDHVIRDATFSYLNRAHTNKVHEAIETIRTSISEALRMEILHDLARVARADGRVVQAEGGFIQDVAAAWGIEWTPDFSADRQG